MALMIDAEPLLKHLAAVAAANEPRYALVSAYRQVPAPVTPALTERFQTEYQKASTEWANACGLLSDALRVAVNHPCKMDQVAVGRAMQVAYVEGYEDGFNDRDHQADRNSGESWASWSSSDDGNAVITEAALGHRLFPCVR